MKKKSLKKFIIGLLIFALTGCILSCGSTGDEIQDSDGAWPVTEPTQEPLPRGVIVQEPATLSETEIEKLDSGQITWGPGSILDGKGRPEACVLLQEQYGKYSTCFLGKDEDRVYLTFDEGYENGYTPKILDTLQEKGVAAAFFVTMDYVKSEPELVRRMIEEGHAVGNHTANHPNMTKISLDEARKEVQELHEYVKEQFDYTMTLFRAPEGAISEQTMALLQSMGYQNVLWSFAYHDWDVNLQMNPQTALKKITDKCHPGAIYLLHAVSQTNAEILGQFIEEIQNQGYEFGSLEEEWK